MGHQRFPPLCNSSVHVLLLMGQRKGVFSGCCKVSRPDIINFVFHCSLSWLVAMQIKSSRLPVWSAGKLRHSASLAQNRDAGSCFAFSVGFDSVFSQYSVTKRLVYLVEFQTVLSIGSGDFGTNLSQPGEYTLSFKRPEFNKIRIPSLRVQSRLISLSGNVSRLPSCLF